MFRSIDSALESLYPQNVWAPENLDQSAGVSIEEGQELAEELAVALKASTFFRPGVADEYCHYIYILCLGREPCLVQLRDADVPLPAELADTIVDELYLRVCLSTVVRFAGCQQVAMRGEIEDDELLVIESPRAGVYDAPLLSRFKRLVGHIESASMRHLDFGDISAPHPNFDPADYASRYSVAGPAVANYFFYPQPLTTEVTELVALSRATI